MAKFLRITEWKKYQHYKYRNAPWVKLYRGLLTSFVWVGLDDASRLLAIVCILLAAETDNKIPLDRDYIKRMARLGGRPDVRHLVEIGFAEILEESETCEVPMQDASKLPPNLTTEYREQSTEREEPKSIRTHFSIPSLGEITAYCQTRGDLVDPQKWFDYYTANGWKVGRNSMKDWRAAIRTWEKNGYGKNRGTGQETQRQPNAAERRYYNNRAERERAFGATVGGSSGEVSAGSSARLGTGDSDALEGEIKKLQ